jgi:DivIVA domain-containing protein
VRTLLTYVFALILVGGLLFLAASFAFGRDEEMAPALPEGTPTELPDDRPATGADLRALRLSVVLRGYRMEEVDWVLDRLAEQIDARDREIGRLRSVLHVEPLQPPDGVGEGASPSGSASGSVSGSPSGSAPGSAAGSAPGLDERDERLTPPDEPVPARGPAPVRPRPVGPGNNPVRGLPTDGRPEPDRR